MRCCCCARLRTQLLRKAASTVAGLLELEPVDVCNAPRRSSPGKDDVEGMHARHIGDRHRAGSNPGLPSAGYGQYDSGDGRTGHAVDVEGRSSTVSTAGRSDADLRDAGAEVDI